MMSRTVWAAGPVALISAGPAVSEGEVVLPFPPVGTYLPGAGDGVPVRAERAGKALPELQGREVGRLPRERPHPIGEGHHVHAHHAAGVVIMLGVGAGPQLEIGRASCRERG